MPLYRAYYFDLNISFFLFQYARILTFICFNGEEANNPIFLPTIWRDLFPNIDLESVNS